MARRGANEGTILERKDGRWVAVLHLGYRDGKRVRKSHYGKDRKAVASWLAGAHGALRGYQVRQRKVRQLTLEITQLREEIAVLQGKLRRKYRQVTDSVREAVLLRDGGLCRYCGDVLQEGLTQMDHYDPEGPETEENLVACCKRCNLKKGRAPSSELYVKGMKLLGEAPNIPPIEAQLSSKRMILLRHREGADAAERLDRLLGRSQVSSI